ncbi:hypothetical protein VNO77_22499 [Canavalia gladiata]|uniref:Uncharacterized protein n=1 Tax=Canavalia gladiata TaxID=3824 RepID=A0AAN9L360_CANGL
MAHWYNLSRTLVHKRGISEGWSQLVLKGYYSSSWPNFKIGDDMVRIQWPNFLGWHVPSRFEVIFTRYKDVKVEKDDPKAATYLTQFESWYLSVSKVALSSLYRVVGYLSLNALQSDPPVK